MSSAPEIAELAWAAGIRDPGALATAVAVAIAESGGNPKKIGDKGLQDEKWGPSVGLWQIRSLKAEQGKGTIRDASKLTDPAFNARSMFSISGGGKNWDAWSVTHPSDPLGYMRYVAAQGTAETAAVAVRARHAAGAAADAAADAVSGPLDAVRELAGVVSDAAQAPARVVVWLSEAGTWKRITYGAIGAALLVVALRTVAQPAVDQITGLAVKAATKGMVK